MTKIDRWIPYSFVAFFALIAVLDGYFVFLAVSTNTGIVTEKAYEKGLNYNQTLNAAAEQEQMGVRDSILYKDGVLTWILRDVHNQPITDAKATVKVIRPTQDGYDFARDLTPVGNGVYSVPLLPPLSGAWNVKLHAQWEMEISDKEDKEKWQTRHYYSTAPIIAP